jgi:hypothetical protein
VRIDTTKVTTERCRACGYGKAYHRQEPAYYGAAWLEPGNTQSVAERDQGCPGWDPVRMTLAWAMKARGRPVCSCGSIGFDRATGTRADGTEYQGCTFCTGQE